jgi:VanZ family protein
LNSARKEIYKTWIAAGLWLLLIAVESTDWLSASNTSRILYPFLHWLTGVDPFSFMFWNFYIRKTGHVFGYFGLSLLLFRAWKATIPVQAARWSIEWARIAFFMTALVACLDEWHQTFIPSRTGSLHDVLLDSSAAFAAQVVIFIWFYFRHSGSPGAAIVGTNSALP